ncbi:MAG: uracil-DNA glycosylase [Campylobacterales bacterium]
MIENLLRLKALYTHQFLGSRYVDEFKHIKTQSQDSLPKDMASLKKQTIQCKLCDLAKTRKNVVFGEGNKSAKVMLIGEGPGASEDESGRPFVGRAGMLLEKIINNVLKLQRDEVFIANIVKCRPPQNRQPSEEEAKSCLPFLLKQIEIVSPTIIVALGSTSYKYLTNDTMPISKIRGEIINYANRKLIATFHPSYLLRNPSAKKEAFEDFLKVKSFI